MARRWPFSTTLGRFTGDRRVLALFVVAALFIAGRVWLHEHPEHDPWAPLDLRDPPGWATKSKLAAIRDDVPACRAVLGRSGIAYETLAPAGEGQCARPDRTVLGTYPLAPTRTPTTCPVSIALQLWQRDTLDAAAREIFGAKVKAVEHLGAYSCRRIYGRDEGRWSEHATGNAIDVAGFVLTDGTRISVLRDWRGDGDKARFLRAVRDGACQSFSTVLSPDYNTAHRDHLHLDMAGSWSGVCR